MTEFTDQQKRWLEGFTSGLAARKVGRRRCRAPATAQPMGQMLYSTPPRTARREGGKLVAEEKAKRTAPSARPLGRGRRALREGRIPQGRRRLPDQVPWTLLRRAGQDSFMCRLRIPNGILNAWQMRGLADAADSFGGGYADVTTRANLQVREIPANQAIDLLLAVEALGLTSRGSGADNIRNITGSPTAGIDPQELIDTCRCARDASLHPQSPRDVRPAAQVQHRVRRWRQRFRCWKTPTTSASSPRAADASDFADSRRHDRLRGFRP